MPWNLVSPEYRLFLEHQKLLERFNTLETVIIMQADTFKVINDTLISTETTVWTPATGKRFRLMGFDIAITGAAGNIQFIDGIGGQPIYLLPAFKIEDDYTRYLGKGILSHAPNRPLRLIGRPLQIIHGTVYGTEE